MTVNHLKISCGLSLPHAGQAKIADFQVAVGVDEDVGGLEVPVENIRRVDVFQASQDLNR
jgi:hypothetical protein